MGLATTWVLELPDYDDEEEEEELDDELQELAAEFVEELKELNLIPNNVESKAPQD
jgi:hypothetical protein